MIPFADLAFGSLEHAPGSTQGAPRARKASALAVATTPSASPAPTETDTDAAADAPRNTTSYGAGRAAHWLVEAHRAG